MSNFSEKSMRFSGPIRKSVTVTASDSTDIAATRALLVEAAGNVKCTFLDGDVDTVYLVAGVWHPMHVTRIWSTGTTATGLHAGY